MLMWKKGQIITDAAATQARVATAATLARSADPVTTTAGAAAAAAAPSAIEAPERTSEVVDSSGSGVWWVVCTPGSFPDRVDCNDVEVDVFRGHG
jgi:hypothetical protein